MQDIKSILSLEDGTLYDTRKQMKALPFMHEHAPCTESLAFCTDKTHLQRFHRRY